MARILPKTVCRPADFAAAVFCLAMPALLPWPLCAMEMIKSRFEMQEAAARAMRIFTAYPDGNSPEGGWPVIWLPDGNMTFPPAVQEKPAALLVGVSYLLDERADIVKQRYFDLTTSTQAANIPRLPGQEMPQTDGAAPYRHFILARLRPYIFGHFPARKDRRTLYGHALGGLFVLQTQLDAPASFQTCCAADPSIWWNRHEIMAPLAAWQGSAQYRPAVNMRITVSGK